MIQRRKNSICGGVKMYAKGRIIFISLCVLLVSVSASAVDYKNWIPLLPETLGGLAKSDEPDGINMEMGGQSWSSLSQEYSGNANKSISLIIVSGIVAPQVQVFQTMSQMQMETQDVLVKTLNVSGYRAVFQLDKEDKKGTLMISVNQQTVVIIDVEPTTSEKELVAVAKKVPLGKIAAQGK